MNEGERQDPENMAARKAFQILSSNAHEVAVPRLGRLTLPGRKPIQTPDFVATTSRGAVTHLTPDNLAQNASFSAAYMALEEFIQKKDNAAIFETPGKGNRRLHQFTAFPSHLATILGPRRIPPVKAPEGNPANALTVFTSSGFVHVSPLRYAAAIEALQPDIAIPLAETLHTNPASNSKKLIRMVERTESWLDTLFRQVDPVNALQPAGISIYAPVLSVKLSYQWDYLRHIAEDLIDSISGLAVYDVNILPDLERYEQLTPLPKLSVDPSRTPHQVLHQVSLGIDLCSIPFVSSMSDAGVAFTFKFPPPEWDHQQPLGINMWTPENQTSLAPLEANCSCYTCSKHHRAFLHHLLNAKEMLGWTLLQIHNHHVLGEFFKGVRAVLAEGPDAFSEASQRFARIYEPEFPEGTGQRPRARGYHFKSGPGQEKYNKPSWQAYDPEDTSASQSGTGVLPSGENTETPPLPDANSEELEKKGFGDSLSEGR